MVDTNADAKVAAQAAEDASQTQGAATGAEGQPAVAVEQTVPKAKWDDVRKENRKLTRQVERLTANMGQIQDLQGAMESESARNELRELEAKVNAGQMTQEQAAAQRQQIQTRQTQTMANKLSQRLSADGIELSNPKLASVREAANRGDHAVALGIYNGIRDTVIVDTDTEDDQTEGDKPRESKPENDIQAAINRGVKSALAELGVTKVDGNLPSGGMDIHNLVPGNERASLNALRVLAYSKDKT